MAFRPAEIERERLFRSLIDRADLPVRFLCAPIGSGKTVVLRAYTQRVPGARYIEVVADASPDALRETIALCRGVNEVVLDGLDAAQPAAVEALMAEIAADSAAFPRLVIAARARGALHLQNVVARGLAAVLDGRDLAFDREEIRMLVERFDVAHTSHDLDELLHVTEGWAVAVAWIVRDAAETRTGLLGAFERWAERRGYLLLEFVAENLTRDPAIRRSFQTVLAGDDGITQAALGALELAGCPIARLRTRLRPYRVLRALMRPANAERPLAAKAPQLLALNLLGSFSCAIGEHHVTFTRRRDQNLLIYVALGPGARVTREELLDAFWPGASHAVASQGLRTTLSRLRRAIGEASGADPGEYLQTDVSVALVLDHVVVDARRFAEHVELGRLDEVRGEADAARRHYRIATGLYKDHLLISEAIEPSLQHHVKDYEAAFETASARMVELAASEANNGERRVPPRRIALTGGRA